jgi:hypothetical protein
LGKNPKNWGQNDPKWGQKTGPEGQILGPSQCKNPQKCPKLTIFDQNLKNPKNPNGPKRSFQQHGVLEGDLDQNQTGPSPKTRFCQK